MQDLNFKEIATHNLKKLKRDSEIMVTVIVICIVAMVISELFYATYTQDAIYTTHTVHTKIKVGWPASVFGFASWTLFTFSVFLLFRLLSQDLRKPALGITSQGVFVNQQMIRNAHLLWNNIESVELIGPVKPILKIKFKDIDKLLKGQFFVFKSLMKGYIKESRTLSISQDECIGDFDMLYQMIYEKIN